MAADSKLDQTKQRAIIRSVNHSIASVVDKNIYWTDEEKLRVKSRLGKAFSQTVATRLASEGYDKTEVAAIETKPGKSTGEKRRYFNDVLLPAMDEELVQTTKRRKHSPYQCVQQLARHCKYEHTKLIKQKAEVAGSPDLDVLEKEPAPPKELLQDTSAELTEAVRELGAVQREAENLGQVISSQESLTAIDQVILEPTEATIAAAKVVPPSS